MREPSPQAPGAIIPPPPARTRNPGTAAAGELLSRGAWCGTGRPAGQSAASQRGGGGAPGDHLAGAPLRLALRVRSGDPAEGHPGGAGRGSVPVRAWRGRRLPPPRRPQRAHRRPRPPRAREPRPAPRQVLADPWGSQRAAPVSSLLPLGAPRATPGAEDPRVPGTRPRGGNCAPQIGRESSLAGARAAAANRSAGLPPPLATWPGRSKIERSGRQGRGGGGGGAPCVPASDGGFQHVSRYARVPRYVSAQEAEAARRGFEARSPAGRRAAPRLGGRSERAGSCWKLLRAPPRPPSCLTALAPGCGAGPRGSPGAAGSCQPSHRIHVAREGGVPAPTPPPSSSSAVPAALRRHSTSPLQASLGPLQFANYYAESPFSLGSQVLARLSGRWARSLHRPSLAWLCLVWVRPTK